VLRIFLLLMPPCWARSTGQGKVLFKYSALAAVTFFVTVNLFGGVLFRAADGPGPLSTNTNPEHRESRPGRSTTLDKNAESTDRGQGAVRADARADASEPDEQPACSCSTTA